jgi:DNA-binding GntR family transcriptional regulator
MPLRNAPAEAPLGPLIERRVLGDAVKDRLLEWVIAGRLAPGTRLVESRIAAQLGVSAGPVREAISALATLGVVEVRPHRGAHVTAPTRKELLDAIGVRTELEVLAVRAVAGMATPSLIGRLERQLAEGLDAAKRGDAHRHAVENARFHAMIVEASGNGPLERSWRALEPFLRTYITATLPGLDRVRLVRGHEPLLDALRRHDPDGAEACVRSHLSDVRDATISSVDEPVDGQTLTSRSPGGVATET